MRTVVMGAGTMGRLFSARLALTGQGVSFVEASETTIEVTSCQGLHLETPDMQESVWVLISRTHQVIDHFDLLVIFTKGFYTVAATESVHHLVRPQTWALSVQSGLGNAELIAHAVPAKRIIIGITSLPADLVAPGVVYSHGERHTNVWASNGKDSPTIREITANSSQAGLPYKADPQVQVSIWEKVVLNTVLNPVYAVTRRTTDVIGHTEEGRQVISRIVSETVTAAQAAGVDADQRRAIAAVDYAFRHHQQHKSSMLQDVEAGHKTEVDFVNGAVAERGKRLGVVTPVLEMLFSLMRLGEGQTS